MAFPNLSNVVDPAVNKINALKQDLSEKKNEVVKKTAVIKDSIKAFFDFPSFIKEKKDEAIEAFSKLKSASIGLLTLVKFPDSVNKTEDTASIDEVFSLLDEAIQSHDFDYLASLQISDEQLANGQRFLKNCLPDGLHSAVEAISEGSTPELFFESYNQLLNKVEV